MDCGWRRFCSVDGTAGKRILIQNHLRVVFFWGMLKRKPLGPSLVTAQFRAFERLKMSTTHSVGKRVILLKDSKGKLWFLLQEQTYSSNCFPHRPEWCYVYFGDFSGAIQNIIHGAASCEGGCLSGAGRTLKTESYIQQWLAAMKKPKLASALHIKFAFAAEGYRTLRLNHQEGIRNILLTADSKLKIDEAGYVDGLLTDDFEVVTSIFKEIGGHGIWILIRDVVISRDAEPILFDATSKKLTISHLGRLGDKGNRDCIFFKFDGVVFSGAEWEVVAEVVRYLSTLDLSPSNVIRLIAELRETIKTAKQYTGSFTIHSKFKSRIDEIADYAFKGKEGLTFVSTDYESLVKKDYFLLEKIDFDALLNDAVVAPVTVLPQAELFS
jgi:hypothetical protein